MGASKTIIALGSNTASPAHLAMAQRLLRGHWGDITFSRTMLTDAIGPYGDKFFNCIGLMAETEMDATKVEAVLKQIERECGDCREKRKRGEVWLDADLLLCGGRRYHESDWQRDYIKILLGEMNVPFNENE